MRYLSVCSGIEAATVAWHPLGWTPVGFSEIEAFPSAVLAHHYPDIPNYGNMTQHEQWPITRGAVDLLVGGTPCQSFSVAGLRKGLRDPRGGLMLTYLEIAQRLRPRWVVWENVPGVLSSNGGRDFGSFLGALGELGYGWAYRVLDAQWCRTHRHPRAVPQRRRRVFVVGRLIERGAGDWTAAAAICFESQSVRRHNPARRASVKGIASDAERGTPAVCATIGCEISRRTNMQMTLEAESFYHPVVNTLQAHDASKWGSNQWVSEGKMVVQPVAYRWQNDRDGLQQDDAVAALRASAGSSGFHEMNHPVVAQPVVAFDWQSGGDSRGLDPKDTAQLQRCQVPAVAHAMTVRRLTPRECERLQGFPDDYTAIPWRGKTETPDGPRYKALGNSMAVNCMEWIGERIAAQEVAQ